MKVNDYFKENQTELRILSKLKLKIDNETEMDILENFCLEKTPKYYSFLQLWRGKIIKRVFACRLFKGNKEYQEVIRRVEGNSLILVRNMYFSNMAGYRSVWKESKPRYYYFNMSDYNLWFLASNKHYNFYSNKKLQTLAELDENLKYCGLNFNSNVDVIDFISIYRKEPQIEILAKLNRLDLLYNSKLVYNLGADKKFRKWFFKNYKTRCNSNQILAAYKKNISIDQYMAEFNSVRYAIEVHNTYHELDIKKLEKYFYKNKDISIASYCDLIHALKYFHLDLTDSKNVYPHDFRYWHDYYINQMVTNKNKEIEEKLELVATKYNKLACIVGDYQLILPHKTIEFINEGEALHHCVGRMGYNLKMSKEESLILFVRNKNDVDSPLATMEFDIKNKKILQLYGDHDSKPAQELIDAINNNWLAKAKRILNKEGAKL